MREKRAELGIRDSPCATVFCAIEPLLVTRVAGAFLADGPLNLGTALLLLSISLQLDNSKNS